MFENTTQPSSRLAWTLTRAANKVAIPSTQMPPPHNDVRWSIFEVNRAQLQRLKQPPGEVTDVAMRLTHKPPPPTSSNGTFSMARPQVSTWTWTRVATKAATLSQSQDNAPNVVRWNKKSKGLYCVRVCSILFNGLQQKLLLMGSRVDDDMLGRILLASVQEAFPTTVEILRSREPSPTIDQITNRLLAKEDEMKSRTTTKRKADDEQLLYTGKPVKNRPFKKQLVKDKCHYCHKIGHHAFECRFKKRDLAKGISRKCIPIEGEDQINILKHDDDADEGFILATTDDSPRSDIEDAWILDSACTADVTGDKTLFVKLARTRPSTMQLADNTTVQSMHMGMLSIQVDETHRLDRPVAKFVPNLKKNILSYRLLLKDGFELAKWDLDVAIMIRDTFVLKFTH
ncbi:hypothetical protein As57867_019077, partial [Aphanomyces stellatus]